MKNVHALRYLSLVHVALVTLLHLVRKRFPVTRTREQQNTFIGPFSLVVTIYLAVQLNSPFQGSPRVSPRAFESIAGIVPPVAKQAGRVAPREND